MISGISRDFWLVPPPEPRSTALKIAEGGCRRCGVLPSNPRTETRRECGVCLPNLSLAVYSSQPHSPERWIPHMNQASLASTPPVPSRRSLALRALRRRTCPVR